MEFHDVGYVASPMAVESQLRMLNGAMADEHLPVYTIKRVTYLRTDSPHYGADVWQLWDALGEEKVTGPCTTKEMFKILDVMNDFSYTLFNMRREIPSEQILPRQGGRPATTTSPHHEGEKEVMSEESPIPGVKYVPNPALTFIVTQHGELVGCAFYNPDHQEWHFANVADDSIYWFDGFDDLKEWVTHEYETVA